VKADVGEGVEFVTVLGPNLSGTVTINELTTVAASYSMDQFFRTGVISGNSFGLQIAAGMNDNIVASATGESSSVLLNSPNADQTNSLRSTQCPRQAMRCFCTMAIRCTAQAPRPASSQ
jgi:hypothetical protein